MERIRGRKLGVKLGEDMVGLLNLKLGANKSPLDTQLRRLKKIALAIIVIEGRRKIFPTPRRMMEMRREKTHVSASFCLKPITFCEEKSKKDNSPITISPPFKENLKVSSNPQVL